MDPPEHTRLRGLLGRAFTPRAVARLEDRIFATAHHLVERALGEAGEGELDFARDMAAELPLLTLADLLGVPEQDLVAALRLVEPGDRISRSRLRNVGQLRRPGWQRNGR